MANNFFPKLNFTQFVNLNVNVFTKFERWTWAQEDAPQLIFSKFGWEDAVREKKSDYHQTP